MKTDDAVVSREIRPGESLARVRPVGPLMHPEPTSCSPWASGRRGEAHEAGKGRGELGKKWDLDASTTN